MNQLMRTTPEEMGLHSRNILKLLERLEKENISVVSMMLLRHNQVLYEAYWPPYTQEQLRTVYSLSKTFTAMAIGIAAGEGKSAWMSALSICSRSRRRTRRIHRSCKCSRFGIC